MKDKESFRIPSILYPALALGLLTACEKQENPPVGDETPVISTMSQDGRLFDLPYPPDRNMRIQQAWTSDFDSDHNAMDIIKGELDNSGTWESFPVLAGADGKACANPPNSLGNAVLIEHHFEERTLFTYSGHLKSIVSSIPQCGDGEKEVKMHEFIGEAGSTGAEDLIHLHWRVFDENNISLDVFDLMRTRDKYPNINEPRFTNGKFCGPDTILIGCPTEPKKPTASPTLTPEVTENSWTNYTSPNYDFSWEIPDDWEISYSVPIGPSSFVFEDFSSFNIPKLKARVFAINIDSSFRLDEYINQVFENTFEKGFVVDQNNPASIDPDPAGVSDLSQIEINGNPTTLLYFHSDEFHSPYIDNEIIYVRSDKVMDIKFSYDGESSTEEAQKIHNIFEHIINSLRFSN